MKALLSIWAWTVIGLAVIFGFLTLVLLTPTLLFDRNRRIIGRAFRLSSVVAAKLIPQWRFRAMGEIHRPRPRTVVVGNHLSLADPFIVSYLPWEMKWMAKEEAFRLPIMGWSMRLAGDIPVNRADRASGKAALERARYWLERDMPVMMFPEGTRAKGGKLLPFKPGAFRLAIETGADVLPIAICGTDKALPKHGWKMSRTTARVITSEPISTAGMTVDDVPALSEQVRERIQGLLEELGQYREAPAGHPVRAS
jgi:1-acyl-sn-glycerol-3-phosphate acyltransferase